MLTAADAQVLALEKERRRLAALSVTPVDCSSLWLARKDDAAG